MKNRLLKCLSILALASLFVNAGALWRIEIVGQHKHQTSHEFNLGAINWSPRFWGGSAYALANAHDVLSDTPREKRGAKLSYMPLVGGPLGTFTSASVTQLAAAEEGPCIAIGSSSIRGGGIHTGSTGRLAATAKSLFTASLFPAPHTGGAASFVGDTWDPWSYGADGFIPIFGGLDISFELPPGFKADFSSGSWNASFSAFVKDGAIDDVDLFHNQSDPELLYTVTCGQTESGMWADVTLGDPIGIGIPVQWNQTEAQMEQTLLAALYDQTWTSDLLILSGSIDLTGVQNATIGYHDHADASAAAPEPASLTAMVLGSAIVLVRRRRRRRG